MKETKRPVGRPPDYNKDYHPAQAMKYALLGLTNEQMADLFGIHPDTIYDWQNNHSEFSESLKGGKDQADANVASMLYKKAVGFTQKKKVAFKF